VNPVLLLSEPEEVEMAVLPPHDLPNNPLQDRAGSV
jgi:hypothetical protein